MKVTRTFQDEGKTLQELVELLFPILLQEKISNTKGEEPLTGE